jgi:RHS repeat-associated protein
LSHVGGWFASLLCTCGYPISAAVTGGGENRDGTGYYRARYYNSLTGRFLSRDPLDYKPRNPDGTPIDPRKLHKYLYAAGDPVNRIDPSGRDELEVSLIDAGEEEEGIAAYREYKDVVRTACIAVYIELFETYPMYQGVSPAVVYDEAKAYCYAIVP